jgi:cystathionine beta-lyase/cystathionine gamma-synthase
MKTYFVRRDVQCANALRVAEFLAAHPLVARVRYPGLPGDPGHALASRQMTDFGSMVTFDLKAGLEQGTRFAEALQLFAIAASLGSTESLVLPPAMLQPRNVAPVQAPWFDIGPGTVRLSIGVEDAEDLIDDLRQALDCSQADG